MPHPRSRSTARVLVGIVTLAAALLVGAPSVQARSVLPYPGYYEGVDHQHRFVSFVYDGHNVVSNIRVGHHHLGSAHVGSHDALWHRTCSGGYCSHGAWISDTQVRGAWEVQGTAQHLAFHAHWRHY